MSEALKVLCDNLYLEEKTGQKISEDLILSSYKKILEEVSADHPTYIKCISAMVDCFEECASVSLAYSLKVFLDLYNEVMELPIPRNTDLSVMSLRPNDQTPEHYKKLIEQSLSRNTIIRLSKLTINTEGLTQLEQKEIISMLIHKMQIDSDNLNWTIGQIDDAMFILVFIRALSISINNTELFYFVTNIFLDRLFTSGFHQPARDICEEILLTSFNDKLATYGFFACFRVYANSGIINSALIYANLCLTSAIKEKDKLSSRFFYEVVFQTIKFFRNVKLNALAIQAYEERPDNWNLTRYERHSLDSTYFTCRLSVKSKNLASDLFDYLNKEREEILDEGENGCTPWLITMYNIKRLGGVFNFDGSGLEQYINLFEAIVPEKKIENQKAAIFGDLVKLKELLKSTLLKLNITRSKDDFVYDNGFANILAGRLTDASFESKDLEGALLAANVSADPIVNFEEKNRKELGPLDIKDVSASDYYKYFPDPVFELNSILNDQSSISILLNSEDRLYQFYKYGTNTNFGKLEIWDIAKFKRWCREFTNKFEFETTTKDNRNQVRQILKDEYEDQARIIAEDIPVPALTVSQDTPYILLLFSRVLSEFPFNLFIHPDKRYISLQHKVVNIISLDWLYKKMSEGSESKTLTKSIWIPIEEGDLTINMLFAKIENTLIKNNFNVFINYPIEQPLSSILNIVTSHGANDISVKKVISPSNDRIIHNLDKIIGPGRILIFLVCYSGSQREYFFKNEIASMVKKYLMTGYDVVIAPFWSLAIDIPEIWLPVFMQELEQGADVGSALLAANQAVNAIFPTPMASLCMHLYGNPYFKVRK